MGNIGTMVAAAREEAGLTQEQLAKALDVHTMTVSRWERGAQRIGRKNLDAVAAALGLQPMELLRPGRPGTPDYARGFREGLKAARLAIAEVKLPAVDPEGAQEATETDYLVDPPSDDDGQEDEEHRDDEDPPHERSG